MTAVVRRGRIAIVAGAAAAVSLAAGVAWAAGTATSLDHVSPDLHEIDALGEHARTVKIMMVMFQFAALLGGGEDPWGGWRSGRECRAWWASCWRG